MLKNNKSHHNPQTGDEEVISSLDLPEIKIPEIPKDVISTLKSRRKHMCIKREGNESTPACNQASVPGMVTQRSCVYGGARVVLMPITDAIHLVHGPLGCASCTWDIRGSRSSGSELYRNGFSTDLQEKDIVFGGEKKLLETIIELNQLFKPAAIFVYATCVVGLIGDDLKSVCREATEITGSRVIPVQSEGFRSVNKSLGHQLACDAMIEYLIGTEPPHKSIKTPQKKIKTLKIDISPTDTAEESPTTTDYLINILGEFNVAGDFWAMKPLLEKIGVSIQAVITGDSRVEEIANAHLAHMNLVQCQKSSRYLADSMEERYSIPQIRVNFFGVEETSKSLRSIAEFFNDPTMMEAAENLIELETNRIKDAITPYRERLTGKKVAVYVGGNKAWSLIRAFEELGMEVLMTGTQNGLPEDYQRIKETVRDGTIIVDDANAMELARLLDKYQPDLLVSGAKEKYMSLKMGVAFCDFNHDRISSFAGFQGFLNFAREVDRAVSSPVWKYTPGIKKSSVLKNPFKSKPMVNKKSQRQYKCNLKSKDVIKCKKSVKECSTKPKISPEVM
ncbi:MAG: nitrogenase molybdenum-iron cofactor biosynthesis protein NifE [Methanobacterium sp. Maddingley MBC34]|nr:MAG: nitrogenase molybdenum-iron cofactor biosynthesis protein NifE [Methanobacterium sp. Maddingley MBC34]